MVSRKRRRKPETQLNRVTLAIKRLQSVRDDGHDSIAVSYSGGKDSAVTLDLCCQIFEHVYPFFLYMVRDLECEEIILRRAERKYNLAITRLPNPAIQHVLRAGLMVPYAVPFRRILTFNDIQRHIRKNTGVQYIAFGHRMDESLQRRGMINSASGPLLGKSERLKKVYPICDWVARSVYAYLRSRKIEVPDNFGSQDTAGFSLCTAVLEHLSQHWPADYIKVVKQFPFLESIMIRDAIREQPELAATMEW